jgi:serine/threonine-protein kinase
MAPEAIVSPERVDARTDLYAVGAVGYFLATGHDVFESSTLVEICAHHLHTKPAAPSKRLGAALPVDFEEAIVACLAKSPDERPADAEQLRARLLACRDAGGWTEANGREWWRARGERIREHRKKGQPVSGTIGRLERDLPEYGVGS